MKKWIQSLTGLVMSAFLALGLGGRVLAEDQEEALPEPAATEVVENKPAPAAEAPRPAEAKPAEVKPAEAKPAAEAPKAAESKPAETKSAEAKPTESKTVEAKPAEEKHAEARPAESKSAEEKPAESKPAEAKSVEAKSAEEKPAESKSGEEKPAESKPAPEKPAEAEKTAEPAPAAEPAKTPGTEPIAEAPAAPAPAPASETAITEGSVSSPEAAEPVGVSDTDASVESPAASEPAPAAEVPTVAEAEAAEAPSEPEPLAEAPAADEAGSVSETPAEDEDKPVSEVPAEIEPVPADNAPAANELSAEAPAADEAEPARAVPARDEAKTAGISSPEEPAPDKSDTLPVAEAVVEGEADLTREEAESSVPVADTLFMETESVSVSRSAANAGQSVSKITIGGKDVSTKDGWTYDEKSGQIGLVDFDKAGVDIVSSGLSGLNIAAAGVNHIRSIVSEGNVNVTGTGILLLDSVTLGTNSGFYLHTPTDVYKDGTGSVAVFLKQKDETYLLVNGGVPGILDEEYVLKDVELVIPSGSSLLLNSGGTMYNKDTGEVILRYSGEDAKVIEYDPSDPKFADIELKETIGSLTIGSGASLTVEKGAEIRAETTISKEKYLQVNRPVVSAADNARISVNGKITGDGKVDLGENTSLRGKGSVEAGEMHIRSPKVLSDCGVTLRSGDIYIQSGGGTIPKLSIDDVTVVFENDDPGVSNIIGSLTSSGNSELVNSDVLTVGSIDNSGTLSLYSTRFAPDKSNFINLTGSVSGGTLHLNSGLFFLKNKFALNNGAKLDFGNVIVYDEAGYTDSGAASLTAPLVVSSGTTAKPELLSDSKGEYYSVPLVVVTSSAHGNFTDRVKTEIFSVEEPYKAYFRKDSESGKYVLDFSDNSCYDASCFKGGKNPVLYNIDEYIVLEYQSVDAAGNLSFYNYSKPNSENDISALPPFVFDNTWLVRIHILEDVGRVHPVSSAASTNTSFTGTGILGGSGTLIGGDMSLILRGPSASEPEPASTTVRKTAAAPRTDWRVVVSDTGEFYRVNIYYGAQEIIDPGQKVTARMDFTLPDGWDAGAIFAVFRGANGKLTAFKAVYDDGTGTLRFNTDLTGTFALVSFPFEGKLYSQAFYDALAELDVIEDLPVRR